MKLKFHLLLLFTPLAALGLTQFNFATSQAPQTSSAPQASKDSEDAKSLMEKATQAVTDGGPTILQVRQQVNILGEEFTGTGRYVFAADGNGMSRTSLKIACGEKVAEYLQVHDGRFVYMRYIMGDEKKLSRIDTTQVYEELHKRGVKDVDQHPSVRSLFFAGFEGLIRQLNELFEFRHVEYLNAGERPVVKISGIWRKDALKRLSPQLAPHATSLKELVAHSPSYFPTRVELYLLLSDPGKYFPYQIEFLREEIREGKTEVITLCRIDVTDIEQAATLDRSEFEFRTEDEKLEDATGDVVARIPGETTVR